MNKRKKELIENIKSKIEKRAWETVDLPKKYIKRLEEIEYIKNADIDPYDLQSSVIRSLYNFYSHDYCYMIGYIIGDYLARMYGKYYINTMATIKLHVNPNDLLFSMIDTCNIIKPHIESVKSFLPRVSPEQCARMLNYEL